MKNGNVFLVGAGPGDPELLTVKALRVIQSAQAVVYDRLVSDAVMDLIPRGVAKFFAGKSCKQKAMTQEEINQLLIALAKKGQNVVRLKGGDPFLFGRGGEEVLALAKANIPFEIIPGITSAQACSAYAGVPLTHRGMASGVRFITGHRMNAEDAEFDLEMNWKSLADPDTTLVVYMGLANLKTIAEKLIEHGLPKNTPAVAIEQGTLPGQRIVNSTLAELEQKVRHAKCEPPTLIIIGKVAALSSVLQWFTPDAEQAPAAFTKMSY